MFNRYILALKMNYNAAHNMQKSYKNLIELGLEFTM